MKIAFGCDHAGIDIKDKLISFIKSLGHEVIDCGTNSKDSCDYPDFALKVSQNIISKSADKGILICGTGIGMSIAANKVKGIRAAACSEHFSAKYTRMHNNSNVLCLGGRVIGVGTALELVDLFIDTPFEGDRHQRRIDKIAEIEKNQ